VTAKRLSAEELEGWSKLWRAARDERDDEFADR
jgi:hypothetical protein